MLKIKSLFWVNGLFLIVLWMLLFFLPEEVFRIVVVILGIETLLSGGFWTFIARNQKDYQYRGLLFFWALFEVVFWLLLLIFPGFSEWIVKVLVILLGISVVIKGGVLFLMGLKQKKCRLEAGRSCLLWEVRGSFLVCSLLPMLFLVFFFLIVY